jgi:hypothetical protein
MARCHPVAVAIKQHTGEEARLPSLSAIVALGGVAGKLNLDRIPERLIGNRLMLAEIGLFVVNDLAPINAVLQHQVERIVGAIFATWLGQHIGWYESGEGAGFIGAIVGAVLILAIYRAVVGGPRP